MSDIQLYQPQQLKQETALTAVESERAVQEVQAACTIAKRFPRDVRRCLDAIMNACTRPTLAEQAVYEYSRGGTAISGPSIRLAESVAQHWGNLDFGFHELYRGRGEDGVTYSEIRAFSWDMETNTRRQMQFRVRHWRDTKKGGYAIKDERDIYELIANQAQRRVRSCIMAVIPGDIFEEAVKQCETTLAAEASNDKETVKKLIAAFGALGVTKAQIEARIQRNVEAITPGQVVQLRKIHASIKDGMSNPSDWFDPSEKAAAETAAKGGPVDPFAGGKPSAQAEPKPDKTGEQTAKNQPKELDL